MASVVGICNIALSNIRAGSINSLTEGSLQAQQCKLKYDVVRQMILTDINWQFAMRTRPLALLGVDVFNWAYAYQYPSDCLKIDRLLLNLEEVHVGTTDTVSRHYRAGDPVINLDTPVEYEIQNVDGNRVIVSNDADLRARFTVNVQDPSLFGSTFTIAFAHLLASELAIPLAGAELGRSLRSDELSLYSKYIASASANNFNEQHQTEPDSDFITIR